MSLPTPKSKHGIPIGDYKPYETEATVIEIAKDYYEKSVIDEDGQLDVYRTVTRTRIRFQYKNHNGALTYSESTFTPGDVFPENLLQKAWGVVVMNQWGTSEFILTHVLEEEKEVPKKGIRTQSLLRNLVNFPVGNLKGESGKDFVRKSDLVDGAYYYGICRNSFCAKWSAKNQEFTYMRTKFKDRFPETIKHPEDDKNHDVFVPLYRCYPTNEDLVTGDVSKKENDND